MQPDRRGWRGDDGKGYEGITITTDPWITSGATDEVWKFYRRLANVNAVPKYEGLYYKFFDLTLKALAYASGAS